LALEGIEGTDCAREKAMDLEASSYRQEVRVPSLSRCSLSH